MFVKKYGKWMAGLFIAAAGMICLWGCADTGSRQLEEIAAEPDMESAQGNLDDKEKDSEEEENSDENAVFSIKISADDKPVRLKEKLAGNDEIEKITIVVDAGATEEKVLDYDYLENLEQLNSLTIHDGQLSDISFVSGLEQLNLLDLKECAISDVMPVAELDRLLYLYLNGNEIHDISPLSGMNLVIELDLGNNPLDDPKQLGELPGRLESLSLDNTGISDITFLARAKYIKRLSLKNNEIKDFEALRENEHLVELDISGNPIENPSIFLCVPNTVLLVPADCEKEPYKGEIEKAFQSYDPMAGQREAQMVTIDNCGIGDFDGDGIDDLGVVVWWWDFYGGIDERRFYLYPGNGTGYDKPLQPLVLGAQSSYLTEKSIVMNEGRVYFCSRQLSGNRQNTIVRVVSWQNGVWECEMYSDSSLYKCYPEENEEWQQNPERTDLITFEIANFVSNDYKEYFYIDEEISTGYFEKYMIKSNKLSNCVYQETLEGESSLPVIVDYYPLLPDFSGKAAGFRMAETLEDLNPADEVLERIIEEYYPDCHAQRIFYNIECLENMENILGVMLPEYFYGIETEEGTVYLLRADTSRRYTYTAYLNGEVCGEYIYNPFKDILMSMEEYENLEYVW